MSCDYYCACVADEREDYYDVAVHAVEEDEFVSDYGDELEDHEEGGWDDGVKV
jgi:hypothetical protein